ncbi:MAG: alpha/beta hydrolase, partial [Bdellovibrionota bacterium]
MFYRFQTLSKKILGRTGYRFELAPRAAGGDAGFCVWRRTLRGGDPGKRLVVVPGFGDTPLSWITFLTVLGSRRGFRQQKFGEILIVEFPGHLGSHPNSKVISSSAELTGRFCALIDHLAPHTLLGQSMGGYLASFYAAEGSERDKLSELILMCPSGLTGAENTEIETVEWIKDLVDKPEAFIRKSLGMLYPLAPLRAELRRFLNRSDTHALLKSWGVEHSMDHRIARIRTATTLIWGERDDLIPFRMFPMWKRELRAALG